MRKQVLAVTIGVLLVLSVFSVLQFWQIKPAQATGITRIQTVTSHGTSTELNVTLSTPTNGNTLIAVIAGYGANCPVSSVTQTNVAWAIQKSQNDSGSGDDEYLEIWLGVVSASAEVNASITFSGTITAAASTICEYSGLASSPLDKTANNTATGTALNTGTTATTSQAAELWVGGTLQPYSLGETTPTNGFTLLDGAYTNALSSSYLEKIVSSTGTANSGTTSGNSVKWQGCIATFKATTVTIPTCSVKSPSSTGNWTSSILSAEFDGTGSGNISKVFVDTNVSGSWSGNVTLTPIWINSTGCWGNYTIRLPAASGTVVGYRWFANDTSNLWVDSGNFTLTTTTDTIDFTKNAVWIYDQGWVARKQNILTANLSGTVADCAANNISYALIFVGYCNAAINKPNYYHTDAFYATVISAFHAVGIKCLAWWEDGGGGTMDITPSNRQNIYDNIIAEMRSNNWDGYHDDIEARVGTDQEYIDFLNNCTVVLHSMGKLMTAAMPFDWQQNTNMKLYMDYIFSCFYSTKSTFEDVQAAAYWQEEFGLYGGDHGASASPIIIGVMHFGGNTYPLCWQLGVASNFMNLYTNRNLVGYCIWMYEYIGLRSDDMAQWNYWINRLSTTPAILHNIGLTTSPAESVPITFQGIPQNSNSSAYTFNISVVVSTPASVQSETLNPLFGTTVHAATGGSWNSYTYTSGPYTLSSPTSVSSVYFYSSVAGNLKIAIYNTTTYTISGWFGTNEHPHILQTQSAATACEANAWTLINVSTVTLPVGNYFFSIKSDTNNMLIQNVNASNYAGRGQFIGENYATTFNTTFQQPLSSMGCDFSVFVPASPNSYTPYTFSQWEDTSTNPTRTLSTVTSNITVTAIYTTETVPSISLMYPANNTYSFSGTTPAIPVNFTASGGTVDKKWYNVLNGTSGSTWVYVSNQTFTTYTTMTGFVNGTYTFYGFANNTVPTTGYSTVVFTVEIITSEGGTIEIIVNTWWSSWW